MDYNYQIRKPDNDLILMDIESFCLSIIGLFLNCEFFISPSEEKLYKTYHFVMKQVKTYSVQHFGD